MWYKAITFLLITLIRIVCLIRITGQPGCEVGFPILNNSPATSQIFWSVWWCCCSILAEIFGHLSFSLTDLVHQLLNLSSPADWSYRLLISETLSLPGCPQVSYSLFVKTEDRITRWKWSNQVKSCPHWIWLESVKIVLMFNLNAGLSNLMVAICFAWRLLAIHDLVSNTIFSS